MLHGDTVCESDSQGVKFGMDAGFDFTETFNILTFHSIRLLINRTLFLLTFIMPVDTVAVGIYNSLNMHSTLLCPCDLLISFSPLLHPI